MTTDPVRAGIMEKGLFLRSAKKCFFGQKCIFPKKNTKNLTLKNKKDTDIYFGKGYFILCTTFPGRGQNMVSSKK